LPEVAETRNLLNSHNKFVAPERPYSFLHGKLNMNDKVSTTSPTKLDSSAVKKCMHCPGDLFNNEMLLISLSI
jgi:hypothetical protein